MHSTKVGITKHVGLSSYKKLKVSPKNWFSRDNEGVGVIHKVNSPKNQSYFFYMMMKQYWFSKTNPKKAFKLTLNAFQKLLWNCKNIN